MKRSDILSTFLPIFLPKKTTRGFLPRTVDNLLIPCYNKNNYNSKGERTGNTGFKPN